MRVTRRSLRPALLFALGLIACRPDVPGRDCKTNADCFTQEVCTDGTCAHAPVSVGAVGAGVTPVGGTPVGGAPAGGTPAPDALVSAPDGLPADAATTDAGAPDAAP